MRNLYGLLSSLIAIVLALGLYSCAADYADDIACSDIGRSLADGLRDGQEYTEFESTHKEFYFDDTEHYDDCSLLYSRDVNDVSEIGVFHAPDAGNAGELVKDCQEYLDDLRTSTRAFVESYAPEELPKLDNAEVRRFGNYVAYAVLPTDKAEDFFDNLEKLLRG